MQLQINGKTKELNDNITILQMLEELNLHPQRVAVELNREIVKRDRYNSLRLNDGDEIEILQFVGGG